VSTIYIGIIASLLWGLGAYYCSGWSIKITHLRNEPLAVFLGLIGAAVGFYVSWAGWVSLNVVATKYRFGEFVISFFDFECLKYFLLHPQDLWDTVKLINVDGTWLIKKMQVKGGILWVIWGLEALFYLIIVIIFFSNKAGIPYCEEIQTWLSKMKLKNNLVLVPTNPQDCIRLLSRIENGDIGYFLQNPETFLKGMGSYLELELFTADGAPDSCVTVTYHHFEKNKEKTSKVLLNKMYVPYVQAENLSNTLS
jgi:hypothetical protein